MGLTVFILVSMAIPTMAATATRLFPLPGTSVYGNLPTPTAGTAESQFAELMWGIIMNVRYVIGAVAVTMIVYAGFRMVTAWGNEEVYTKMRSNIFYAIIGLTAVGFAGEFAKIFSVSCQDPASGFFPAGQTNLPCTAGSFLKDPNAIVRTSTLFSQRTQILITFIKYFIGSVAVLMAVRSGLRLITKQGAEEQMAIDKKNLGYSIAGLVVIILADTAISQVFYKLDLTRYPSVGGAQPALDPARGVAEIVGFTNFIVSIVGPVAVLVLLAGGIMYISAAGKEETMNMAKRMIVTALIGIIIIYGAFAIVSTFVGGSFGNPPAESQTQVNTQPTEEITIPT